MKAGSTITLPHLVVRIEPVMVDVTHDTHYRQWRQVDTLYFLNDTKVSEEVARAVLEAVRATE